MDPFTKFSNHFSMPDEFMGKHGGKIEMFGVMDTLNISRISRFNYVVFFFFLPNLEKHTSQNFKGPEKSASTKYQLTEGSYLQQA